MLLHWLWTGKTSILLKLLNFSRILAASTSVVSAVKIYLDSFFDVVNLRGNDVLYCVAAVEDPQLYHRCMRVMSFKRFIEIHAL